MGTKKFKLFDECCGCGACRNVCPQSAIILVENIKGFLYPRVDNTRCVECDLCRKICPIKGNAKRL